MCGHHRLCALSRCHLRPGGTCGFPASAPRATWLSKLFTAAAGSWSPPAARAPQVGSTRWGPMGRRKSNRIPGQADSAIIFAPAGELVARPHAQQRGNSFPGRHPHEPIPPLDYEQHLFYESDLHSVTANARDDGRDLLAEAAAIPIRPHTTVYPLAEADRALQDLKDDRLRAPACSASARRADIPEVGRQRSKRPNQASLVEVVKQVERLSRPRRVTPIPQHWSA